VYFLENIGFLTEKKYRSLKYLDIRIGYTSKGCRKFILATAPFALPI
jgi:hypothetical protein